MRQSTKEATPIAREKFFQILKEEKVPYTDLASWTRVEGPPGRRMYIPHNKSVRRIDISGFKLKHGGQEPPGGEFGRVFQQLDMKLPEEKVLENFRAALKYMQTLPPSETARALANQSDSAEEIPVLTDTGGGGKGKKGKSKRVGQRSHIPAPRPSA